MAAAAEAVLLLALVAAASAHTYHLGSCPRVPPMPGFSMDKFMGKWHVLEKTSTRVRCLTNEYLRPGEREGAWERGPAKTTKATSEWEEVDDMSGKKDENEREWSLVQRMQAPVPAINNVVNFVARLTLQDDSQPAAMTVKFPLNIMGSSSYIVFDTDYDTYAGIYSCQNIAFWHRHSASIMSRDTSLDPKTINKLRNKLTSYGIEVRDLDRIRQTCPEGAQDGIQVHVKPNVFRTNSTDILQDANDVLATAADAARRAVDVYNTVNTVYTAVQGARKRRESMDMSQLPVDESEYLGRSDMSSDSIMDSYQDSTAQFQGKEVIPEHLEEDDVNPDSTLLSEQESIPKFQAKESIPEIPEVSEVIRDPSVDSYQDSTAQFQEKEVIPEHLEEDEVNPDSTLVSEQESIPKFQAEESIPEILEVSEVIRDPSVDSYQEATVLPQTEESISLILGESEINRGSDALEFSATEETNTYNGSEIHEDIVEDSSSQKTQHVPRNKEKITEISSVNGGEDVFKKLDSAADNSVPIPEDETENKRNLERDMEVNERNLSNFLADLTVDWMP